MKVQWQLGILFAIVIFSIASLGWLMIGCSTQKDVKASSCVIFVMFDISGSTADPRIRQQYFDDFQKILAEMRGGEVLIGDLITENTLATLRFRIDVSFPAYDALKENRYTHKRKMQKAVDSAKKMVEKLIFEYPPAPETDLLNAFQAADKVFNGEKYKSSTHKILVVFSDMIETKRYNFLKEELTQDRIREIINTLRKKNELPNLKGVKVWVAGATAAVRGGLSLQKIYQIENFWLRYFEECGADLTKERYSVTLINFELPK